MTDLVELKRRVDQAVEELAVAQNARHLQHNSLVQLLADLEVKFDARHEELVYCHSRIADLEKANDQLGDLLNTVIQLIESGSVQDPKDPIFRASQMAADLVALCAQNPIEQITAEKPDGGEAPMVTVEAQVVDNGTALEHQVPPPPEMPIQPEPLPEPIPDPIAASPLAPSEPIPDPITEPPPMPPEPIPEPIAEFPPAMSEPIPEPIAAPPPLPSEPQMSAPPELSPQPFHDDRVEIDILDELVGTEPTSPQTFDTTTAAPPPPPVDQPAPSPEPEPEPVEIDVSGGDETPAFSGGFEDVTQEELDVELLLDDGFGSGGFPEALLQAIDAAKTTPDEMSGRLADVSAAVEAARRGDTIPAVEADDRDSLDIPGIETVVDFDIVDSGDIASPESALTDGSADEGDTDIKALMARIQEAAEKARARADLEESKEPTLTDIPSKDQTGTS